MEYFRRRCGLKPILLLKTATKSSDLPTEGNVLFDKIFGAKIYTTGDYGDTGMANVKQIFSKIAKDENAYQIPVGGSNHLGSWLGFLLGKHSSTISWPMNHGP